MQSKVEPNLNTDSLYENISVLDNKEYLVIIDLYHIGENDLPCSEIINTTKDISRIDRNVIYLLFHKQSQEDLITQAKDSKNKNIFNEDKITSIHFIVGFALAKNLTIYLFTNEINTTWLKVKDNKYQANLKFSEYEYIKITLDYLFREKKRIYEEKHGKQPSKLSILLSDKPQKKDVVLPEKNNTYKNEDIRSTSNFQNIIENICRYFKNSPPKDFQVINKIINNFSEQNINYFYKQYNIGEYELSFLILSELLDTEVICNKFLKELIKNNQINSIEDIISLTNFSINIEDNILISTNTNNVHNHKQKRKKNDSNLTPFSLSNKSEEEYKNLILNSPSIANFSKNVIIKILNSINFINMDKVPTNPSKYKNYIYSLVNNQELQRLSKKILNIDHDNLVNTLTEGIIIEFMKNNLIVIANDKKIYYNMIQIEQEKFRLNNII